MSRRERADEQQQRKGRERGTHQAELQSPDPARPELDDFRGLSGLRDVYLDAVPPALALDEPHEVSDRIPNSDDHASACGGGSRGR